MVIDSEAVPGVRYHLEQLIGDEGLGTSYLARRDSPEGSSPVVLKLLQSSGPDVPADLVAAKEAVALGRLNESVPPTPFVVRFIDAGSAQVSGKQTPWTALEYIHGGVEGTTLEERVTYAVHRTGYAFDANRTGHAIRCLASGLSAIHNARVIHRNLTPGNVLCCGFGESEIFKISDFGLARAAGLSRTFVNVAVGTVGYSAPEQGSSSMGPQADIFSLAAVVYYLLTGQHYFLGETPMEVFKLVSAKKRQSVTAYPSLCPELMERPEACAAIDQALARATALNPNERPATGPEFAATVLPALSGSSHGPRSTTRLLSAVMSSRKPMVPSSEPKWQVRIKPRDDIAIGSVAWDTDGHALALGQRGAWFYNGQTWLDAARLLAKLPAEMTFTERYEAGGWLVGGNAPVLSVVDAQGVSDSVAAPNDRVHFSLANGRLSDFLVAVQHRQDACPLIWTLAARRWLRPLELPAAGWISTLQRLDDTRWVVGGRASTGGGFAAVVSPLEFRAEALAVPAVRAFTAGASVFERSLVSLVGSNGAVLHIDGSTTTLDPTAAGAPTLESSQVAPDCDLSAVSVNLMDREWCASMGSLWCRDPLRAEPWRRAWNDPSWHTPFISIFSDTGLVVAMTADGGILEGRTRSE
jgi:serine/threonine protein kinase